MSCVDEIANYLMTYISIFEVEHSMIKLLTYKWASGAVTRDHVVNTIRSHIDKEMAFLKNPPRCMFDMASRYVQYVDELIEALRVDDPKFVARALIRHCELLRGLFAESIAALDRALAVELGL